MRIVSILHLRAGHDRNGNPRRIFIGIDAHGRHVRVTDEGLAGTPEWVRGFQNEQIWPVIIDVVPAEYQRWKLLAGQQANDWKLADA